MAKSRQSMFLGSFALVGVILTLSGCVMDDSGNTPATKYGTVNGSNDPPGDHAYSTNGVYDDNGVEPAPNNGNQNFGQRH